MQSRGMKRRHAQRLQTVAEYHVIRRIGSRATAALHHQAQQRHTEHNTSAARVIIEAIRRVQPIAVALAQIDVRRVIMAAQQSTQSGHAAGIKTILYVYIDIAEGRAKNNNDNFN